MSQLPTSVDRLMESRRSIRKYRPEAVPEAYVEQMIRAASFSPSPANSQPVRFVQLQSATVRRYLAAALSAGRARLLATHAAHQAPKRLKNWINAYWRYTEFMLAAPVLLAVAVDDTTPSFSQRLAEADLIDEDRRWDTDRDLTVGMAVMGLMLKARELDLGTCVMSAPLVFAQGLESVCGVGPWRIKCFVTVGYPAESPSALQRKSIEELYRIV